MGKTGTRRRATGVRFGKDCAGTDLINAEVRHLVLRVGDDAT